MPGIQRLPGILVVDDDPHLREMFEDALACLHYRGFLASDEATAVELLEQQGDCIDLLLLDLYLGESNGFDLLRRLHQLRPELPAFLMSGWLDPREEHKLEDYGFKAFFRKPLDLSALFKVLKQYISAESSSQSIP